MTIENENNGDPGETKRVDIEDHPVMEETQHLEAPREEDPAAVDLEVEGGHAAGTDHPEDDAGSHGRKTGRKRSKKATRAEIADLLARKNDMLQKLRERLSEAEKLIETKEDRLIRLAAEFENYKKRTRREWDLLKNQANAGLLSEILGVLDDLDRAFEHSGDSTEHFKEGITLIYSSFLDLLKRNGLGVIEAVGKPFDPQYHEAVAEMHSEDIESGFVAEVVQKGYILNDQVLRPARVVVSKGSGEREAGAD